MGARFTGWVLGYLGRASVSISKGAGGISGGPREELGRVSVISQRIWRISVRISGRSQIRVSARISGGSQEESQEDLSQDLRRISVRISGGSQEDQEDIVQDLNYSGDQR